MHTPSYFKKSQTIPHTEYCYRNEHKSYISMTSTDSPIFSNMRRRHYVEHINKWLQSPVCNIHGVVSMSDIEKKTYYETVESDSDKSEYFSENDFSFNDDSSISSYLDTRNTNTNTNTNTTSDEPHLRYLKIASICDSLYNDILQLIDSYGYTINDVNQFKEDLIHYVYILSDIDDFVENERE
jgi:hypothetical protein